MVEELGEVVVTGLAMKQGQGWRHSPSVSREQTVQVIKKQLLDWQIDEKTLLNLKVLSVLKWQQKLIMRLKSLEEALSGVD
jgi:hypothetical protein